jgi:hypothetical protein
LPNRKDAKSFLPIMKFDARTGKFTRVDRVQDDAGNWESELHEIPADDFEVIADLANLEIGWIAFGGNGQPPDFKMVAVANADDIGNQPSDKHKEGFRVRIKLTNGAGDDVREMASTAIGFWKSMDELHCAYEKGVAKNKNKLPLIGVREVIAIEGKSTLTYRPDFKILKWVARPSDL